MNGRLRARPRRANVRTILMLPAVLTLGMLLSLPVLAVDAVAHPTVSVRDAAAPEAAWIEQSEMNLTRRATSLGQWQGDVTASASSGAPGAFAVSPGVTARLGLGAGLMAELTASGTSLRPGSYRPGVGLKWQFVGGPGSGLQAAVMALFRPEGFNEPEGEVELHLLGGYRSGRTEIAANFVVGGDPDGKDQDVEGHLGGGYRVTQSLLVGAEAQSRAGLGTKIEGWGRQEHIVGPSAQLRIGSWLLSGIAGAGANQLQKGAALAFGGFGLLRLGYRF